MGIGPVKNPAPATKTVVHKLYRPRILKTSGATQLQGKIKIVPQVYKQVDIELNTQKKDYIIQI